MVRLVKARVALVAFDDVGAVKLPLVEQGQSSGRKNAKFRGAPGQCNLVGGLGGHDGRAVGAGQRNDLDVIQAQKALVVPESNCRTVLVPVAVTMKLEVGPADGAEIGLIKYHRSIPGHLEFIGRRGRPDCPARERADKPVPRPSATIARDSQASRPVRAARRRFRSEQRGNSADRAIGKITGFRPERRSCRFQIPRSGPIACPVQPPPPARTAPVLVTEPRELLTTTE